MLLFTYLNPVERYGVERLARDAKAAGIDGCLLTDASVEEADGLRARHARVTISIPCFSARPPVRTGV